MLTVLYTFFFEYRKESLLLCSARNLICFLRVISDATSRDLPPSSPSFFALQLYSLASDPSTFTDDPHAADADRWAAWKVDLEKRQGEIEDLMINNAYVRQNYKDLVPDKTSHKAFWSR